MVVFWAMGPTSKRPILVGTGGVVILAEGNYALSEMVKTCDTKQKDLEWRHTCLNVLLLVHSQKKLLDYTIPEMVFFILYL